MTELSIQKIETKYQYACCIHIRAMVYTVMQGISLAEEIENEDEAVHYLATWDGKPAGTARYRVVEGGVGKIERLAVLDEYRGKGVGKALMQRVADDLEVLPEIKILKLSAQDYIIPLHESLGFRVQGEGYLDAGLPHHDMVREKKT